MVVEGISAKAGVDTVVAVVMEGTGAKDGVKEVVAVVMEGKGAKDGVNEVVKAMHKTPRIYVNLVGNIVM